MNTFASIAGSLLGSLATVYLSLCVFNFVVKKITKKDTQYQRIIITVLTIVFCIAISIFSNFRAREEIDVDAIIYIFFGGWLTVSIFALKMKKKQALLSFICWIISWLMITLLSGIALTILGIKTPLNINEIIAAVNVGISLIFSVVFFVNFILFRSEVSQNK